VINFNSQVKLCANVLFLCAPVFLYNVRDDTRRAAAVVWLHDGFF